MQVHRVRTIGLAALLALALAGCSGNNVSELLEQPTSPPATAQPTVPAAIQPASNTASQTQSAGTTQQTSLQSATPIPQAAQQGLDADEQIVANVYDRVAPAVVRITTEQGLGSGYLIDTNGHIITNNHVIQGNQGGQVRVSFSGLFETIGQVVGADADADVAVVKVDELPQGVTPVELGDSSQVRVGERTIAIGNPLGQDRTVTTGIVSALGRTIDESSSQQCRQQGGCFSIGGAIPTDAAINPGNSGGPLLDSRGRVIGMNTAILSQSGASSGIGFAVPVNLIKKVANALIQQGRYDHPYLGVGLRTVTTLDAKQNNLPSAGVLIEANQGGPVAQAGLRGQAILTAINGTPMTSEEEVISFLELNTKPGDTVTLTLVSGQGQQQDLKVQLGARPSVQDRGSG
ncbi:MAG TPA: trypsin-like peptidase domain-containing protein [Roseiflexaceae bacterium]